MQNIYKKLLTVITTSKFSDSNKNINALFVNNNNNIHESQQQEQFIESLIDNLIINIINIIKTYDDTRVDYELKLKENTNSIDELKQKQEEQIKNLTKSLKEKETIFNKQKESLVNYYEQLINDVNSRVKVSILQQRKKI